MFFTAPNSSVCNRSAVWSLISAGLGTGCGAKAHGADRISEGSMLNRRLSALMQEISDQEPPIAGAGGVVYRWSAAGQLEFLLIRKRGGFWTLPKGQIKAGEDERAAVVREVAEE